MKKLFIALFALCFAVLTNTRSLDLKGISQNISQEQLKQVESVLESLSDQELATLIKFVEKVDMKNYFIILFALFFVTLGNAKSLDFKDIPQNTSTAQLKQVEAVLESLSDQDLEALVDAFEKKAFAQDFATTSALVDMVVFGASLVAFAFWLFCGLQITSCCFSLHKRWREQERSLRARRVRIVPFPNSPVLRQGQTA